jgi:hypothetical protein
MTQTDSVRSQWRNGPRPGPRRSGISTTFTLAVLLGAAQRVIDGLACFVVARLFNRERLATGSKSE